MLNQTLEIYVPNHFMLQGSDMVIPRVHIKQWVRMPKRTIVGINNKSIENMGKRPMTQLPRPSTKPGNPSGPAGNNPPKPKR